MLKSLHRFWNLLPRLAVAALLSLLSLPTWAENGVAAQAQGPYSVLVSIADQKTYVYKDGQLVRSMVCSTGLVDGDDDTPLGSYLINESGKKKGTWFYSSKYREGAKYWVGFIGGTYLFHSVAMDEEGHIIESEAAKLGKPASHGCVRLAVENARWFYETIPPKTLLRIIAESNEVNAKTQTPLSASLPAPNPTMHAGLDKASVPQWLEANFAEYKQQHTLSCELALTSCALSITGIRASESEILATVPRSPADPEKAFVCDDIDGGRRLNGKILWDNYGTHPPVVVAEIEKRLAAANLAGRYEARELKADDSELRRLVQSDPNFLGAIVWLVGHPERWGQKPPVNERGMVLGEHVRFLEPRLSATGAFRIWDPENGRLLLSQEAGAARELFSYRVVGLFSKQP